MKDEYMTEHEYYEATGRHAVAPPRPAKRWPGLILRSALALLAWYGFVKLFGYLLRNWPSNLTN
jgi:hypothetical protein